MNRLLIVHGGIVVAGICLKAFGDSIVDSLWKNTPLGEEHPGAADQYESHLVRGRDALQAPDTRVKKPGDPPSKADMERQDRNKIFTAVCFVGEVIGLYALCVTTAIASLAEADNLGLGWAVGSIVAVVFVRGWFERDCYSYYKGRFLSKSTAHLFLLIGLNLLPLVRALLEPHPR